MSPGVATACRLPDRISLKGCSFAGRGAPNTRSHASDPIPITHESPASISRNPTARRSAERSGQNPRITRRASGSELRVTTKKIAARASGAATGCAIPRTPFPPTGEIVEVDDIAGTLQAGEVLHFNDSTCKPKVIIAVRKVSMRRTFPPESYTAKAWL